jgi:hypothetical protein
MNQPRHPNDHDPLLQRYHEANALDPSRPDPSLRERVLARAREQAALNARAPAAPPRPEAANDRLWTLRALGSLAVLGLVGLLALQFDRSPPEDREVALGTAPVRAPVNGPETAPPAAPAIAPPAASSATPSTAEPSASPAAPPVAKAAPPATADRARLQPLKPPAPAPAMPTPAPAPTAERASEAPPAEATTGRAEAPASLNDAAPPPAAQAPAPAAAQKSMPAPMMRSRPAARMAAPMASPTSPDPGADALGQTPLMRAAARGDAELVERLLAAGADRSQTDHRGWTAADHARHAGHEALAQRLTPPAPPAADGQR